MRERQWSNPVPLKEYLSRIDTKLDPADKITVDFRAFIVGLCEGFHCEKHPNEEASIEYKRDNSYYRSVCAPCRAVS